MSIVNDKYKKSLRTIDIPGRFWKLKFHNNFTVI